MTDSKEKFIATPQMLEAVYSGRIQELMKLLDESRERERKLIEAEHKLSDAYLRIRKLVSAWQTPIAPTPEQIYELTENKIKELIKACAN